MQARIVIVFIGILTLWTLLTTRAAYLQFLPHEKLNTLQAKQFSTVVTLKSRRGSITDINGRDLAMSMTTYSLYADPKIIEKRKKVARQLAPLLNTSAESILAKMKDPQKRFVWIERQLNENTYEQIKNLKVRGLSFVEEWKRVYPNENILAQTIGFIGADGQGLEGVELGYDSQLQGNVKKVSVKRDARGRPLIQDGHLFTENAEGSEVRLTVDTDAQYVLEGELQRAIQQFEADGAVGVILDAKTSAIKALATLPTFDLNKNGQASIQQRRNKTITDTFEPGSTLKTFVLAAAIKENLIQPNTKIFCENGQFKVGKRVIREAESSHSFGLITAAEILAYSSNIGTTKVAFMLGANKLRASLMDFGFGTKLGVDVPGEAKGIMQALPWHDHLMGNISFGHGLTVSPLQMAAAYAVIANGGVLNQPYIVDSIRDNETGKSKVTTPKMLRRVLSEDEAQKVKMMLVGATTGKGTGLNAQVPGFVVAGKTGTAQKANPKGRGYLKGAYVSSFAGFIPASDPRYVIYIAVDHPKKAYYGAQVAAPVFSRVASYLVRKDGLSPQNLTDENVLPSNQKGMPLADSKLTVEPKKKTESKLARIKDKLMGETKNLEAEDVLAKAQTSSVQTVPDLNGLSMREVLRRVQGSNIEVKFIGKGMVKETSPAPGSPLPENRQIQILLE